MPAIHPEEERAGVSACVREIWARRQVLMHDCGVADAKHVARVSGAAAGTMLHVDGEYLSRAIDLLRGLLLGAFSGLLNDLTSDFLNDLANSSSPVPPD